MGERRFVVYILLCADGSYYTGMTDDLDTRIRAHEAGLEPDSYTHGRRPVRLVWSETFADHDEAFRVERQIKGWSRAKKEALIQGDWDGIQRLSRRRGDGGRQARLM